MISQQPRPKLRLATICAALLALCGGLGAGGRASAAEPVTIELKSQASAKKPRPPIPDGKSELSPHHVPTFCSEAEYQAGEGDPYNPTYGYYWSDNSKQWIARPRCYPQWRNLKMSPSAIVEAGKPVTMTAIPTEDSNSGRYAPITGTISWNYIGTVIAGCGPSDMSCTVLPDTMASDEWQWFGFHVSMPRTFFIADTSEFCAGRHICAGFTTNAWSFVGIRPKNERGELFGKVTGDNCKRPDCRSEPLPGVLIEATRSEDDEVSSALTNSKGEYSILVPRGGYVVKPTLEGHVFEPFSTTAVVNPNGKTKGKTGPLDFNTCAAKGEDAQTARALKDVPCPTIDADYKADKNAPVSFTYKGENWKPSGGPIVVSWGYEGAFKSVGGVSERKSFSGDFKLDAFYPMRRSRFDKYGADDDTSCWGTLRAKQGKIVVEHEYIGPKNSSNKGGWTGYLITTTFQDPDGARLRTGDLICEGEDKKLQEANAQTLIGRGVTITGGVDYVEISMGKGDVDVLPIDEIVSAPKMTKCVEYLRGEEQFETHYTLVATKEGKDAYSVKGSIEAGGCPRR